MAKIHSESNSSHIATKDVREFDYKAGSLHKARPENCAGAEENSPSELLLQAFRGMELSSCEQKRLPDTRSCSYEGPCEVVISTEVVKDSSEEPQDADESCEPKCLGEQAAVNSSPTDDLCNSDICDDIRTSWELLSTADSIDLVACEAIVNSRLEAAKEQLKKLPESAKSLGMTDEQLQAWKLTKCIILSTTTQKMIQDRQEASRWKEKWVATSDAYVLQCFTCKALKDQLDALMLRNAYLEQQARRNVNSSTGRLTNATSGDSMLPAADDTVDTINLVNRLSVPIFALPSHTDSHHPRKRRLCTTHYHDALEKAYSVD